MFASRSCRFVIPLALVFLLVQPVAAGGWTVVTLDELPANLQAEEPFTVGFTVRQHGRHPINVEQAGVTAYHPASRKTIHAPARQEGKTGHYVAELVLPQDGRWTWVVHAAPFPDAAMPELLVAAPLEATSARAAPLARGGFKLGGPALLGALSLFHQRQPIPGRSAIVAAALTIAGHIQAQERAKAASAALPASLSSPVTTGKALFVAKGCATCHVHEAVDVAFSVQVGPDLTSYPVVPEYVRIWLKDPKQLKPATEMPQLELSESEIENLVAFLSASSKSR